MKLEKPAKRMTLRELMTHTEKCTRDLIDHFHSNIVPPTSDFRDLNRPVRRRSNYPTLITLLNALQRLEASSEEAMIATEYLLEQLQTIRDGAKREIASRL